MNPLRAVVDCVVFLQAAGRRTGPARKCLELVDAGNVILCLSTDIISEIEDVLDRPLLRRKFPLLGSADSEKLLRALRARALIVASPPNVFRLSRDPDDEPYVDLAVAANADYLVTWNERH